MPHSEAFLPIIMTGMNEPWEAVGHLGTRERFPKHNVVAGSDADVDGVYYLASGLVRLSCITRTGKEYAMMYMGEGMLFNENDVFHKGLNHFLTSIEPLETIFFPRAMFTEKFFGAHPDLAMNLISSLSQKSRVLYALLGSTRSLDSFAQVCRALYRMHLFNREDAGGTGPAGKGADGTVSTRAGKGGTLTGSGSGKGLAGGRIVPRLSQQELAAFLGMHRASMHTAFSRLKAEGIIGQYSRKELVILDIPGLEQYVFSGMSL